MIKILRNVSRMLFIVYLFSITLNDIRFNFLTVFPLVTFGILDILLGFIKG